VEEMNTLQLDSTGSRVPASGKLVLKLPNLKDSWSFLRRLKKKKKNVNLLQLFCYV
jgi:hypothetical protein